MLNCSACSQQHSTETQLLWKNKTSNRETIEPLHFRSHQGHEIPTGGKKGEVEEMKRQKTTNQYVLCIVYWDPNKREERREKWRRWRGRKPPICLVTRCESRSHSCFILIRFDRIWMSIQLLSYYATYKQIWHHDNCSQQLSQSLQVLKGMFTNIFYQFWIVMGCGIADFGRRCL